MREVKRDEPPQIFPARTAPLPATWQGSFVYTILDCDQEVGISIPYPAASPGKGSVVVAFSGIDSVQGVGLSDESGGAEVGTSGVTGPRPQEVGRDRAVEEGCGRAALESIRTTTSSSRCSCGVHIRQPGRKAVRKEPGSPDKSQEPGEEDSHTTSSASIRALAQAGTKSSSANGRPCCYDPERPSCCARLLSGARLPLPGNRWELLPYSAARWQLASGWCLLWTWRN